MSETAPVTRHRLALVVAVVVGLGVAAALFPWPGGSDDAAPPERADGAVAACLGPTLSAEGESCGALRQELDDQDPDGIDVILLVPATEGSERTAGVMLDSLGMWQSGLAAIDVSLTLNPRTDRVGDGESAYPLLDPEVILIAASVAEHEGPGAGRELAVYDADGTRCAIFDDVFSHAAWPPLPGFRSHHQLPEGTLRQPCADGGEVCVAVNATLDPNSGVSPFEAFTLLGDELGHCLRQAVAGGTRP